MVHTDTQVRIDRRISRRARQILVLTIRDMKVRLGIPILLRQPKINHIHLISPLADAHQEVIRLDIAVDETLGMDVLDAGDELVGEEEDGLEGELAVAEVEEVLERGAEQVEHHGIVVAFRAEPAHEGDADAAGEGFVDARFVFELRVLGFDRLELDGDFFARDDVCACDAGVSGGVDVCF